MLAIEKNHKKLEIIIILMIRTNQKRNHLTTNNYRIIEEKQLKFLSIKW